MGEDFDRLKKMKDDIVAQQSSITPADEEVAREIAADFGREFRSWNVDELASRITTALAEARRAGTPTTEARERASITMFGFDYDEVWFRNRLGNEVVNELLHRIAALSSTPGEQWAYGPTEAALRNQAENIVFTVFPPAREIHGDSAIAELRQLITLALVAAYRSATPSDGVAQRARAAAQSYFFDSSIPKSTLAAIDALEAIIISCFTATDVERTCTWTCEPNPDIEMWKTDCGNAFQFEADGPTENKMKFCAFCGKQLAGRDAEEREEGEGDG